MPKRFLFALFGLAAQAAAGSTTITVSNTVAVPSVKRFGVQMSDHLYYDRLTLKNLVWRNAGFEGLQYQTVVRCASGSSTGCVDDTTFSQWQTGFWDNATYEFIFGAAKGRSGTVVTFVATPHDGVTGASFTFEGAGATPATGDYFIVRKYFPGGADIGWNPELTGGATVSTEMVDLPPGTAGRQCLRLSAAAQGQFLRAHTDFGWYPQAQYLSALLNGTYRLTFLAKGAGGTNSLGVIVTRGATQFVNRSIALTSSWASYTVDFSASETAAVTGYAALEFNVNGSSALVDDISLVQTNTDPANTTAFRDAVIDALRTYNPGILRGPNKEQGEPLDNLIGPPFAKLRTGYNVTSNDANFTQYGWHEFLDLCEYLHTEPYLIFPMTFSSTEVANAVEYLAGPATSPYGARRAARGHPAPWTDSFTRVHIEYGNESWNPVYRGATMFAADYGVRGNEVLGVIKQSPYYSSSKFNLILGVQAANPYNTRTTHNASANHDMLAIGPYIATEINDYESDERLFGGLFAEASWWSSAAPTPPGPVRQTYDFINGTTRPVPMIVYEVNLHSTRGSVPQDVLDRFAPSIGAGLAVADHMLIMLREFNLRDQALFSLAGYQYTREDLKTVLLWGVTRDMGVTDRKRPQYLALKLVNEALAGGGDLVQTTQSGDDPHWNQPLTNRIALDNVPYIQSFAFVNGGRKAVVIFNLHRTAALDVVLAGPNAPSGAVTMRRLSANAITDTNESAENVTIQTSSFTSFDPAQALTLPPFSMTVLIHEAPPPIPTGLLATAQSASQVSLTWNASSGATLYDIARMANGGSLQVIATVNSPSYSDTGVTSTTAYLYRVRAIGTGGTSPYSSPDLATTIVFSDEPLVAGVTIIRRAHVIEARDAVTAVCATAGSTPSWSEAITAGATPIRANHVLELRSVLSNALTTLGLPAPSFTNPVAAGSVVRAADIQDLRSAVR
ncbi:MAG TPA: hypothetical protein VGK31_13855 [Thermoanaerobaculia bacterium]